MNKSIYILIISFFLSSLNAQVGVTILSPETEEQYTLFSSLFDSKSYLIDNCGRLINQWSPTDPNGLSSELLPNGNLVRGVKTGFSFINQPSTGGAMEIRNWEDEQIWYYEEFGENYIQHHDFAVLPNGNIMFLGWEIISPEEQLALGKDSAEVILPHFWGEYIKEVKPVGSDTEIVWEWHQKDHFVQDYNPSLENFGEIFDSPHLLDINYKHPLQFDLIDPYHANALDYDPIRDEVVINLRSIGEFWILDHSTTTEEAATNEGGNSGKGGSIIYRWGNPEAYQQNEDSSDWKLFGAHGTNFVNEGLPDEGKIIVFNNGVLRPVGTYSTIEMIEPDIDTEGNYYIGVNGQFATKNHTILHGEDESIRSDFVSNAHQTINGNTFINEGDGGRLLEVDNNQNILWEYIIPISNGVPVNQNATNTFYISFIAHRYPIDFITDNTLDLSPGELIELNPDNDFCSLVYNENETLPIKIKKTNTKIELDLLISSDDIFVFSINGQVQTCPILGINNKTTIDIQSLSTGIYVLNFKDNNGSMDNYKFVII